MTQWLATIICATVVLSVLVAMPYFMLLGGARRFLRKTLFQRYNGIEIHDKPQIGDVAIVYHTYRGFLLWFVQDEHRVIAPPDQANKLLARLLRFNLTFGMMSCGLVFVPFLAIGNYLVQKRSIQKQMLQ